MKSFQKANSYTQFFNKEGAIQLYVTATQHQAANVG